MIEVFVVLLIGSILIFVLNKMPEKGAKLDKQKMAIGKFFEAFHKTPKQQEHQEEENNKNEDLVEKDTDTNDIKEIMSKRDILIREAEKLLEENKLTEAEEKYVEVLKIDEHDTDSYKGLGNICFIKKDYKNAEDIFEKLTKIIPKDSSNYCNLGMCCYKKNEFKKAIDNYNKALKIEKKPTYYKNLGITFCKLKKYEDAMSNLLLSLDKKNIDIESFNLAVSILDDIKDTKTQKKAAISLAKFDSKNTFLKKYF